MRAVCRLVPSWLALTTLTVRAEPAMGSPPIGSIQLPFDRGEVRMTAGASGPDHFEGSGDYQEGSLALALAVPVLSRRDPDDGLTGWRLLAQLQLEGKRVRATMLHGDESIAEAAVGLTALYLSQRDDLYALYGGAAIAQSAATLSDPTVNPAAIGLGTYRTGRLTWIYGGGFGVAFGRPWLLPLGGLAWRASPGWTFSTVLPFKAEVRHELTWTFGMSLIVSLSGDRYSTANDDAFPGAADTLTLKLAQLRAGIRARYRPDRKWTLHAELGVMGPRRLQIADGVALDVSSSSRGTAYLATGVSYAFDGLP